MLHQLRIWSFVLFLSLWKRAITGKAAPLHIDHPGPSVVLISTSPSRLLGSLIEQEKTVKDPYLSRHLFSTASLEKIQSFKVQLYLDDWRDDLNVSAKKRLAMFPNVQLLNLTDILAEGRYSLMQGVNAFHRITGEHGLNTRKVSFGLAMKVFCIHHTLTQVPEDTFVIWLDMDTHVQTYLDSKFFMELDDKDFVYMPFFFSKTCAMACKTFPDDDCPLCIESGFMAIRSTHTVRILFTEALRWYHHEGAKFVGQTEHRRSIPLKHPLSCKLADHCQVEKSLNDIAVLSYFIRKYGKSIRQGWWSTALRKEDFHRPIEPWVSDALQYPEHRHGKGYTFLGPEQHALSTQVNHFRYVMHFRGRKGKGLAHQNSKKKGPLLLLDNVKKSGASANTTLSSIVSPVRPWTMAGKLVDMSSKLPLPGQCCVVGPAGSLLDAERGAEIDECSSIFRYKHSPPAAREAALGTKTSFIVKEVLPMQHKQSEIPYNATIQTLLYQLPYRFQKDYLKVSRQKKMATEKKQDILVSTKHMFCSPTQCYRPLLINQSLLEKWHREICNLTICVPTGGYILIRIAMEICTLPVKVFGFTFGSDALQVVEESLRWTQNSTSAKKSWYIGGYQKLSSSSYRYKQYEYFDPQSKLFRRKLEGYGNIKAQAGERRWHCIVDEHLKLLEFRHCGALMYQ